MDKTELERLLRQSEDAQDRFHCEQVKTLHEVLNRAIEFNSEILACRKGEEETGGWFTFERFESMHVGSLTVDGTHAYFDLYVPASTFAFYIDSASQAGFHWYGCTRMSDTQPVGTYAIEIPLFGTYDTAFQSKLLCYVEVKE